MCRPRSSVPDGRSLLYSSCSRVCVMSGCVLSCVFVFLFCLSCLIALDAPSLPSYGARATPHVMWECQASRPSLTHSHTCCDVLFYFPLYIYTGRTALSPPAFTIGVFPLDELLSALLLSLLGSGFIISVSPDSNGSYTLGSHLHNYYYIYVRCIVCRVLSRINSSPVSPTGRAARVQRRRARAHERRHARRHHTS